MTDNKKEQERQDLHTAIWKIADDLRGSVDGWDFKSYVIGAMFYRFLSENLTDKINDDERTAEDGDPNFEYSDLEDEDVEDPEFYLDIINSKGFFIKPSQLFKNVLKRAIEDEKRGETPELNVVLYKIFSDIEESSVGKASEKQFKGLFRDFDVNSAKLGSDLKKKNERLLSLLKGVAEMKLSHSNNTIDAFGDAYEYLMAMYASQAGKSGGEFFTPQEVSELLAKIATQGKTSVNKVYDPACGSGSLLLKVAKELEGKVDDGYFGQEINLTTYNLCRINMLLHNVGYEKFDVFNGDTLTEPCEEHWDEEPFEVVVSNPPYSIKWKGDDDPILINDERFSPAGVLAPKSKADLAFVLHSLAWLAPNGIAAIVCFPGIMYRGGAEQKIRKYLVSNNFVDAVIQLPSNLFYGTSIATCIMVLKRGKRDDSVLFVDASNEFVKVTNNNKLTAENIEKIARAVAERKDEEYFAKLVPYADVAAQDYNLSVSTYVEQKDEREVVDIDKLNREIEEIVAREETLRAEIAKIIEEL